MAFNGRTVCFRTLCVLSVCHICCYKLYSIQIEDLPHRSRKRAKSEIPSAIKNVLLKVCKNSCAKDPGTSFHRFPMEPTQQHKWLRELHMKEHYVKGYSKVCCRHLPGGDNKQSLFHWFLVALRSRSQNSKPAPFFPESTCKEFYFFSVQLKTPHTPLVRSNRESKIAHITIECHT